MRLAMLLTLSLMLAPPAALASGTWASSGHGATVQSNGDLLTGSGASVSLWAETPSEAGFAGAITSLDAAQWHGHEITLSGSITVLQGNGAAALWIRADGADGSLAFRNSAASPVKAADGAQSRAVSLYVPASATSIKLGATLQGLGQVSVGSLRLQGTREPDTEISAYEVLEAAMDVMEAQALGADRVDWPAERRRRLTPALNSAPAREAHPVILNLVRQLDDRHSAWQPARDAADYQARATPTHPAQVNVSDGIGYISVPGLAGTDREQGDAFSADLCQAIERQTNPAVRGWIVDLRRNGGGNMWPMLAGLRALLGDHSPGAFVDRAGASSPWRIRRTEDCSSDLSNVPVAVLIGPNTASSGEAVAVAFRARRETRFFGLPTAGLATSNRSIELPDQSMLMLTTAVFTDRLGNTYPTGIAPDVQEEGDRAPRNAAHAWLRTKPWPDRPQ